MNIRSTGPLKLKITQEFQAMTNNPWSSDEKLAT